MGNRALAVPGPAVSRPCTNDCDHARGDDEDEARPCPECSTSLMLTRIGGERSPVELVPHLHGWCPFCEWEGWLDG